MRICSLEPPRDTRDAFGVSSVTRKSKTFTGFAGWAEGGVGAAGGASTRTMLSSRSWSGASSTYALRGGREMESEIVTAFLALLGFALYSAP